MAPQPARYLVLLASVCFVAACGHADRTKQRQVSLRKADTPRLATTYPRTTIEVPVGEYRRFDYAVYRIPYPGQTLPAGGVAMVTMAIEPYDDTAPARFTVEHFDILTANPSPEHPPRLGTRVIVDQGLAYFDIGHRQVFVNDGSTFAADSSGSMATQAGQQPDGNELLQLQGVYDRLAMEKARELGVAPGDDAARPTAREFVLGIRQDLIPEAFREDASVFAEDYDRPEEPIDRTEIAMRFRPIFFYPAFTVRVIRGGAPGTELVLAAYPQTGNQRVSQTLLLEGSRSFVEVSDRSAGNYTYVHVIDSDRKNFKTKEVTNLTFAGPVLESLARAPITDIPAERVLIDRAIDLARRVGHTPTPNW